MKCSIYISISLNAPLMFSKENAASLLHFTETWLIFNKCQSSQQRVCYPIHFVLAVLHKSISWWEMKLLWGQFQFWLNLQSRCMPAAGCQRPVGGGGARRGLEWENSGGWNSHQHFNLYPSIIQIMTLKVWCRGRWLVVHNQQYIVLVH